jgi:hypothetical protein
MANDSVFEVGLAMAGAISAGAYSAGVVDFMFQALDEWERLKRTAPGTVPNHSVCIRAAAGASAGSITAALAAVAVAGGLRREPFPVPQAGMQSWMCTLPALYTAWVTMPDMASPTGAPDLLANTDLVAGAEPRSVLNAQILEDLTDVALQVPAAQPGPPAGPAYGGPGLPYLAKRLHLYLTLSNMRGVPYKVTFGGGTGGHFMMSHGDRAHYIIEDIGTHAGENDWLRSDPGTVLQVRTVPQAKGAANPLWQDYGRTALASAAFPIGLAARPIKSNTDMYKNRSWPGLATTGKGFAPDWPATWTGNWEFGFMSLDGGLIDNEPFEYARRAIMPNGLASNERDESLASAAVLMIDPFPEGPDFSTEEVLEASIIQVAKSLFPMLKNQARFKPDELAAALDNTCYSRWMVAPSRRRAGGTRDEPYAIATGLLGGFGGFLDESFRAHDYQLGRRNCQKFLRDILSVRDDNPLVYDSVAKAPKWAPAVYNDSRFRRLDPKSGKYYCSVIPLVGDAADEVPAPEWARIDEKRVDQIEKRIKARADAVVPRLLASKSMNKFKNWLLRQAWSTIGEGPMVRFIHASIESDLIRRDQVTTWSTFSDNARAVLAELTGPGYDYRTINGGKGMCRATGLGEAQVRDALGELRAKRPKLLWSGQVGNQECWTLVEKRPGWIERNNPVGGEPSIG